MCGPETKERNEMAVSWLKTGDDAKALVKQAEAEAAARQETMGKLWHFWLEKGETAEITFVDGLLDPKYGGLNPPRFYLHTLFTPGKPPSQYICPEKTDPDSKQKCPICAKGERATLVAIFTVIDHRPYVTKGKQVEIPFGRKLFVCTPKTFEALNAIAIALKGNGLMGRRFSVTRGKGEQAPRVGEIFTALDKEPIEELKKKYIRTFEKTDPKTQKKAMVTENAFVVADYATEFVYKTADELNVIFASGAPAGTETPPEDATPAAGADFDGVL